MRRVCFIVLIFCLFSSFLKAQDRFYSSRNYAIIDGLPQSQVTSMLEDKSGYLWIGTQGGGLARFDGREFKVYTTLDGLLTNHVTNIYLDSRNTLWLLHEQGITKYNGREFTRIQSPNSGPPSGKVMWRMFDVNDTLFVLSARDKITKIYNDSIHYWEKSLPDTLKRMHVGPNGEACFYLQDESFLVRMKDKTVSFKPALTLNGVFNFFNYKDDILFRTKDGVYKVDLNNKEVVKVPWTTNNYVLYYDEKDDVLWTSNAEGIMREKFNGNRLEGAAIVNGVEASQVLRDSEGNTWIATNGNGLYKYFIQDFRRYDSDNIRAVMTIAKDHSGTMWLGTMYRGLWKVKDGIETSYIDPVESYRNVINCVRVSPQGEVWVGTGHGLGQYNEKTDKFKWYFPSDGLPGKIVSGIQFNDDGIWISTNNGLCLYDGKKFKTFTRKEGLPDEHILQIHVSKPSNTLYVGTASSLYAYRNDSFQPIQVPEFANARVLSLQTYNENYLVMGTAGGGVMLINPSTGQRRLITTRDGLASDFVYFAGVDDKHYLWIGTEKGINRVLLDEALELVENLHFNYDNGLTGVETNQNAFYLSPEEKFFGVVDGLYEFNHAMDKNPTSFDVHLSDVQILYGEYSAGEYADSTFGFFRIPYNPQFPPDKNHLTFHFNRVDKRYSKSVKYKYLLENFDTKWSQPSSVNSVTYSNLPPGDYLLKVMVTNNKGSWADARIEYAFTINSPFYKTASFIAGMFVLVAGIITLIFYLRLKQRIDRAVVLERVRQREQEAVRKEIARDFHDEMGNQLTRIINYISLLKLNGNGHVNGSEKNGTDLYTKVEDSAKYLYSGTRDFIWSIDPVNDELSKLFLYIRDFGEKLFEEKNISFRAFNEIKEPVKLPYGFCRQANLIFKEAMTNAFKYSQAKNVALTLKQTDNDDFEMIFEDDGIGFYTGDIQKLNGLQNIRERADRIKALLRIHSEKNVGTKIILNFKLTKTLKYGVTI
jgi:signal transduction histidine kinase